MAEHPRGTGNTGQGCPANWQARMPAPPGWRGRHAARKKLSCAPTIGAQLSFLQRSVRVGAVPQGRPKIAQHFSAGHTVGKPESPVRDERGGTAHGFFRPCRDWVRYRRGPSTEVLGYWLSPAGLGMGNRGRARNCDALPRSLPPKLHSTRPRSVSNSPAAGTPEIRPPTAPRGTHPQPVPVNVPSAPEKFPPTVPTQFSAPTPTP